MTSTLNHHLYYLNSRIYDLYHLLKKEDIELTNDKLWRISEFYACLLLSKEHQRPYYVYEDVDEDYKIERGMCKFDTGIDVMDCLNDYGQVKLRKNVSWRCLGTFLAHLGFQFNQQCAVKGYLICNNDAKLHSQIQKYLDTCDIKYFQKKDIFKQTMIEYCESLMKQSSFKMLYRQHARNTKYYKRPYQEECIQFVNSVECEGCVVSMPTGSGKSFVMARTINDEKKTLILVPRIVLMEQMKEEILKYKGRSFSKNIQCIGDSRRTSIRKDVSIVICIFNSAFHMESYIERGMFDVMYIDEAHLIFGYSTYDIIDDVIQNVDMNDNDDLESIDGDSEDDCDFDDFEDEEYKSEEYKSDEETSQSSNATNGYKQLIKNFTDKIPKWIAFSATIDPIQKPKEIPYFKVELRKLIDEGYLSPYNLVFPISKTEEYVDTTCSYLVNHTLHIIVYTANHKEGKYVVDKLNSLEQGCAKYVDCNTPKQERKRIEKQFKEGQLKFIVNVRVYTMGFDAPITMGICLLHVPMNKNDIIQRIGRALRLHPLKKNTNIIVPCSPYTEDERIGLLLKSVSDNDEKIKNLMNHKQKGMIEVVRPDIEDFENLDDEEKEDNEEMDMNELCENFIDEIVFDYNGNCLDFGERWMKKLEELKKYIDENEKLPSQYSKNQEIKSLGKWMSHQHTNYKKHQQSMKNEEIKEKWEAFKEEYKEYFKSNEEKWSEYLQKVKKYIDENEKLPSTIDKNQEIKSLGKWMNHQHNNYKKHQYIMKNEEIKEKWEIFKEEYKEYFISNEEKWYDNLQKVKEFINENHKLPSEKSKNQEIKQLGQWMSHQHTNYKKHQQSMKNEEIKEKWEGFKEEYKEYFISNEEKWYDNLQKVKEYINKNHKLPSKIDENQEIKQLGQWMSHQHNNYKKNQYIMKNEEIKNKWEAFKEEYKEYFIS